MRKVLPIIPFLCVAVSAGGIYYWFVHYKTPVVREHVETPLYTVKPASVASVLQQGKPVIEWGPLPASAFYPGALAFPSPTEAQEWLDNSGKAEKDWRIYELSGDFTLDTHMVRGLPFTNKTLLVAREFAAIPK